MSCQAIAAALSLQGVSAGERLAAFSLASFANRDQRAWPGWRVAAARAGLSKSQYLASRDGLERRGLIVIEQPGGGRGHACVIAVRFAELGPWFGSEVNAPLFEAVLGYSRSRGSARLLLATLAALADEHRSVDGFAVDEVTAAAGMAESTYRRAHATVVASGDLVLEQAGGGRSRMNRWLLSDPQAISPHPATGRPRRVAPGGARRPLIVPAKRLADMQSPTAADGERRAAAAAETMRKGPESTGVSGGKGPQSRTVSSAKGPGLTGVSGQNPGQYRTVSALKGPGSTGAPGRKGAQSRTVSRSKTPPLTPPETPPANARAGREPQNPGTTDPPNPPEGGSSADQVLVEETRLTVRGRRRRRLVPVDLGAIRERLRAAEEADLAAWEQVRTFLREAVGESTFEIWLERLELIAVDLEGTLIVSAPPETVGWVARRFGRILDGVAGRAGRRLRVADEAERKATESLSPITAAAASAAPAGLPADALFSRTVGSEACVAGAPIALSASVLTDRSRAHRDDKSTRKPTYTSADPSSYTDVYTQQKEVS